MANDIVPQFSESIRKTTHNGEVYYAIIDLMAAFSENPNRYWSDLKHSLIDEGFQLYEKIVQLKITSLKDGKKYATDCASRKVCLRILQSVSHKNAQPLKDWLADRGDDALNEIAEQGEGKSQAWVASRQTGKVSRHEFTKCLHSALVNPQGWHYGAATNELSKGLWGRDTNTLKSELGIPKNGNLRDHQSLPALHYIGIAEWAAAQELGNAEQLSYEQAAIIIRRVSRIIGVQANQLGMEMGLDIATGKPLLASGQQNGAW